MTMITTWNQLDIVLGLVFYVIPSLVFQIWVVSQNMDRIDFSRKRKYPMKWLTAKELPRFANLLQLLFSSRINSRNPKINKGKPWKLLYLIVPKVQEMWIKSGITFTITYWSEVLRLVVQYLDCRSKPLYNSKTWVKIHRGKLGVNTLSGLPKILPIPVKQSLRTFKGEILTCSLTRGHLIQLKLILSFLSFFRACSPKFGKLGFESVTGPFIGSSRTLREGEIARALKSLGITTLSVGNPSIFRASAKVGPNLPVSTLGCGLDLVGWMMRPKKYLVFIKICWRLRYFTLLLQFLVFSFLILPLALLCWYISMRPLLGHIAVLKEARGKRRKIGITDFWTQILFRPLHDSIYKSLGKLVEDGTGDQSGPIIHLLNKLKVQDLRKCNKDDLVQSLDLSAATDRLPVDLQVQVLNLLGYPGDLWKSVLEREWNSEVGSIRYEVGQPMGAYSSFAMLALTNHVLVHMGKVRAKSPTVNYAVLGDDVAIAGRKVSNQYRHLLTHLGVEVNPIKGFDGSVLEFAKQLWIINGINISPLGAKNILLCIRNPAFLPSILFELWNKRFPLYFRRPPRNKIYTSIRLGSKWKPRGIERPFITSLSLINLVSKLWYKQSKLFGDLGWVNSLLHLASYIGPRSGLWYVGSDVRFYLRNWDRDLYQKLWWGVLKRLVNRKKLQDIGPFDPTSLPNLFVRVGVHSNYKIALVTKIKFERERYLGTFSVIRSSWVEGYNHIRRLYQWPLQSLPLIRNWFTFENRKFLVEHHLVPFIYTISILCSPSLVIVAWDIVKQCLKVVPQAWSLILVRIYRLLIYYNKYGFINETIIVFLSLIALTHDPSFTVWTTVYCLVWHLIVKSHLMKLFINRKVHWTKHYGFQGRNIVTDITSKVMNPYDGVENLLMRTELEFKSDEVPAYKETLALVKYEPVVKKYLALVRELKAVENKQKISELKEENKLLRKLQKLSKKKTTKSN